MIYGCRPELGSYELVDLMGTKGTAGRLCLVFMGGKCWLDGFFFLLISSLSLYLSISPLLSLSLPFFLKGGSIVELD